MEAFLRDLGLEEYYPRFMAQGMDDVDEVRTSRQLDTVLETVGMDCNPGHVSAFTRALAESDRGISRRAKSEREIGSDLAHRAALPAGAPRANKKQKMSHEVVPAAADPAAAVAAAMAAAKARGGGVVGGGDAVKRAPGSGSGGARALLVSGRGPAGPGPGPGGKTSLAAASEAEVLDVLARFRARDYLRLLGLPGAPVDDRGRCDWKTHPVSKPGDVALRAKLLQMRLDPESAGAHPLAAEARRAVCETLRLLDDKETKREILTLATRRRVDEMRAKNIGDVRGGYVSATGVHYAAGAAAAAIADYKTDDAGEGPAMNPAARIRAGAAAVEKGVGSGGLGSGIESSGGSGRIDERDARAVGVGVDVGVGPADGTDAAAPRPEERTSGPPARPKTDLGSIRDKLKKKKGGPRFM